MSPFNLEDVETYLLQQAKLLGDAYAAKKIEAWLRARFHELREREKALLNE